MASFHHSLKSGGKGTATKHAAYIARQGRHKRRQDLVFAGHGNMPSWTNDNPKRFWESSDQHERNNAAVYKEHEIALANEFTREQLPEVVEALVNGLVGRRPYQFAVHAPRSALDGAENVHLHLMFSNRIDDGIERTPSQTFKRYNAKNPELGGRKKEGSGKGRRELREEMISMRQMCAEVQNAALEKYGHAGRVDHRSLKQQGILRTPEKHLGQAAIKKMTIEDKKAFLDARR